jgi:hypothetical protein
MPLCKWDLITSAKAELYYNAYFYFHTINGIICAFMVMLKLCTLPKFGSRLDKNTSHEQLLICLSLAMRQT